MHIRCVSHPHVHVLLATPGGGGPVEYAQRCACGTGDQGEGHRGEAGSAVSLRV